MRAPPDGDPRRTSLVEELRSLDELVASLTATFDDIVAASESVNTDDEHDPEGATIAFERAQAAALRDHAMRRRSSVEQALADLDAGTYGVCTVCGGPIGDERLDALPDTDRCVTCAAGNVTAAGRTPPQTR